MLVNLRKTIGVAAGASLIVLVGWALSYQFFPGDKLVQDVRALLTETVVGLATSRIAALTVLVLVVEALVVGWHGSSIFRLIFNRSKSAVVDSVWFLLILLKLANVLEVVFTLGASIATSRFIAWISSHYGWSRITLPSDGVLDVAFSISIYWLATSFVGYWGHRLMHTPMFWHLHRFHHAATELNVLTVFRSHPLEPVVLRFLTVVSPLIFFSVPDRIILVYFIVATSADLFAHSQVTWGYGWIGRWLIQSPRVHQVHHSIDEEHRDLHFSNCPLWDHMFGTWYKGSNLPSGYGIPDPAYEVRPFTQFCLDAWLFYMALVRWVSSPLQRLRASNVSTPQVR